MQQHPPTRHPTITPPPAAAVIERQASAGAEEAVDAVVRISTGSTHSGKAAADAPAAAPAPAAAGASDAAAAAADGDEPMRRLYADLCRVFAEEKARAAAAATGSSASSASASAAGAAAIDRFQPPAAFARLDARVRALLASYAASGAPDLSRYLHWNAHHYVRNLVDANEDFELMVLCWQRGQGSRVHNHADSHCWVACARGPIAEERYVVAAPRPQAAPAPGAAAADGAAAEEVPAAAPPGLPGVLRATSPCPRLRHVASARMGVGDTAYINDGLGLHSVRCPGGEEGGEEGGEGGGVTIHLYAPPIRR